jgi:hypothetical protein
VNVNVASGLADRAAGPDVMVVSGGSVSTGSSGLKAVQSNCRLIEEPWYAFSAPGPASGKKTRNS